MVTTTKKTTKVVTSMTWSSVLKTEDGTQFATMTGAIDTSRPLGTTSLVVHNHALYAANEADAMTAYEAFKTEVAAAVGTFTPSSVTEVGDNVEAGEIE